MTLSATPQLPAGPEHKAGILFARDLAMMATASRYNVDDHEDRQRSARDLSRFFFHVAEILDVDLFIEAGAKDGESSRRARRRLDPKRIVAFEANPFVHQKFAKINANATRIEYEHLALTDQPGMVTFNVRKGADGEVLADGQASLLKHEHQPGFVEVNVKSTSLDTYFTDHPFDRAALWVDVEGATRPVLSGGRAVLDKAGVVIVEVEDRAYFGREQWLRADVLSYLYDRGLVPIARDFQSRYQYNIVLVRHDLVDSIDRLRWALTLFSSNAYAYADAYADAAPGDDQDQPTADTPAAVGGGSCGGG